MGWIAVTVHAKTNINMKKRIYILALAVAGLVAACTPESKDYDLGALPVASFTATPVPGNPNRIAVNSTTQGSFIWNWTYGTTGSSKREWDTFSFAKKGEYSIQLTTYTKGGFASAVQKVTIAQDAPGVDILKGGNMEAGAEAFWTKLNTGGTQTTIEIANGVMKFSNTGNTNGAIYQAVTVKAGKEYTFSGTVKGGGATNTWFEIYIGATAPAQGSDYSDNKFIALNTWSGCGGAAFDGDLAIIGCDGTAKGKEGKIKFTAAGTAYIIIKGGSSGGTMGATGITIDNVKFLEEQ